MAFETILVENTSTHVGIVTLNRPDQLNTFTRLCTTEDAHEWVAAFLGKRNPQWKLR